MTPLDELLLKWHDRSLTPAELAELNAWLQTHEGRARLRQEFAFDAGLREALLAEKARSGASEQARAFETIEVRGSEPSGAWFHHVWQAVYRWFKGSGWKAAGLAGFAFAMLCVVVFRGAQGETFARIEGSARGVTIVRAGKLMPATGAGAIKSGDQIQIAPGARAVVAYLNEPTRIELQGGAKLRLEETNAAKRIELLAGIMTAKVAPQPRGRPLMAVTPHAEALVMGTEFLLSVTAEASRIEVLDGVVQFVNREDGKSVMVSGGNFATAAKGAEMAVRSLLPEPWHSQDIGEVGLAGAARLEEDRCTAKGAGRNTCLTKDQFHFVYQPLDGDGEIAARVVDLETSAPQGRAGVIIRESLRPAAPHAFLFMRPDGNLEFEHRLALESKTDRLGRGGAPYWLRLARKGDSITAYKSTDGQTWTKAGGERIKMGRRIYVGLGVSSWDNTSLATSVFDNVRVLTASR